MCNTRPPSCQPSGSNDVGLDHRVNLHVGPSLLGTSSIRGDNDEQDRRALRNILRGRVSQEVGLNRLSNCANDGHSITLYW